MIVCVEAGCGLDQAIVKATDELEIAYPALRDELRLITTEIRAGKPRLEAFKNFAARTSVDDVRSLVAMLVQTDRFGTSIAQALRTHAETSRTKRRQRAEERAAKIGVKLVFPLVFFLFPGVLRRDARAGGHSIRSTCSRRSSAVTHSHWRQRQWIPAQSLSSSSAACFSCSTWFGGARG